MQNLNLQNDTSFVNIMTTYIQPCASFINLWINFINVVILIRPIFKGSLYKYHLFNSVFDFCLLLMISIKPFLRTHLTEHIIQFYVFIYFSSVFLMCSDLTNMAALIERISKLSGKKKFLSKNSTYRTMLVIIVVFSAVVNSPVLFMRSYFELEWYKNNYYELILSNYDPNKLIAKLAIINTIVVNLGIYFTTIFLSNSVSKLVKRNARKLKQIIELEQTKSTDYIIKIIHDIEDMRDYEDDDADVVDLDNISINSNQSSSAKHRNKLRSMDSKTDLDTMEKSPPSGDPNGRKSPEEVEAIRKKMSDLVSYNTNIFLTGHSFFLFVNLYQKGANLIKEYNYIDSDNKTMAVLDTLSSFTLYATLGLTFITNLVYNIKFRYIIKRGCEKFFEALCCAFVHVNEKEATKLEIKSS